MTEGLLKTKTFVKPIPESHYTIEAETIGNLEFTHNDFNKVSQIIEHALKTAHEKNQDITAPSKDEPANMAPTCAGRLTIDLTTDEDSLTTRWLEIDSTLEDKITEELDLKNTEVFVKLNGEPSEHTYTCPSLSVDGTG